MNMKKISVVIPVYNRYEMLFKSFAQVINHPNVGEIIIVDDCSDSYTSTRIQEGVRSITQLCNTNKIRLFRNENNLGCFANKREAVSNAENEYVLILDSDNVVGADYIDVVMRQNWQPNKVLQPCFARPRFDFRKFNSLTVDKTNIRKYLREGMFNVMLNAMNYFVHRDTYLATWDNSIDPVTSDTIWQNYCWLRAGHQIYITPGLMYDHGVDNHGEEEPSYYLKHLSRTPKQFHNQVMAKLKSLR